MSHEAMFGRDPMKARGYEDLVKAVYQLWRFFSHCRRGYTGRRVAEDAVGVVLTLDNWLVMAETLRKKVLDEAVKLANEKDPEIIDEDRRPIAFVAVPDLEQTLSEATSATFKQALLAANSDKYAGWRLYDILRELVGKDAREVRAYPYAKDIGTLLPWWDETDALGA